GGSATFAAKFLAQRLSAQKFASLDPETFYNFVEQRPQVRIRNGEREILWPANEFTSASDTRLAQDVIIGMGVEPHLRWRAYIDAILRVVHDCHVELVVTLGALLADVVYSRPVRLTGTASDPGLARRLNLSTSRYEGPTGIVGTLHDACKREGLPAISIWANVPHYIAASPNIKAALVLVRRVFTLLDFNADLSDLESAAGDFDRRVASVLASDAKVAEYVRRLEERDDDDDDEQEYPGNTDALPSGEELARELEEFLREQRRERGQD
ncbi:MAG: PAC2 family protein, partial [Candidatus Tectomicrobia bacterium]|nr:PAC2 family protein [Candidatus Tectomicrobia bacterium]